jgi:hypothetical protein
MKGSGGLAIAAITLGWALTSGIVAAQTQASTSKWNPPRTVDGQPDMQGYWDGARTPAGFGAAYDIENGAPVAEDLLNGGKGEPRPKPNVVVDPPEGTIPYQAWASAIRDANRRASLHPTKLEDLDSHSRCLQMGVPRMHFLLGFQIVQPTGYVVIVEFDGSSRTIPLDGRPHIGAGIKLWAGDSVGHWEGNTLVVDVTNINEHGWYDWAGNFHSNYLHLIERWTFTNADTIEYEVTSYDAKVFTKPWTLKNVFVRNKKKGTDAEQWEDACYEGERDVNAILQPNEVSDAPR